MDFGVALATPADAWKTVQRAETAGFRTAWFYDTQMLSADLFTTMGAAAVKTDTIRLATGMLDPVQPDRAGRRKRARHAQPSRPGPDRLRDRHGLHRPADDGIRQLQARGHG